MQRIVNQLEPVIKLRAADGLTSFRIENIGAVDAYNVRVQPIAHRYYESLDRIAISSASMENLLQVETLSRFQPVTNRIDRFFLVNEAKMQQPENHNIIELRVNYRKRNDDQDYTLSTYYFFSPEGKWVSEVSAENFDDPIYEKMLSAVLSLSEFGLSTIDYYSRSPSDRLHIRE